jgi:uncharacterized membrane protein YgdD (TMEM256/DUF423 family)
MGAYGAHKFKPADAYYDLVFERANKYHFMGSFLLAIVPTLPKRTNLIGSLAAAGLVGFSGSCYAVAMTEDRSVGKLAPIGYVTECS